MSFRFVTVLFLLVQAAASHAATVSIEVRAIGGRPLPGAVVTIDSARPVPVTLSPRVTYQIEQRDIAFQPSILIVPVGATVAFPNRDKVRHHVYSFSKPKRIDLKLYGREDTRNVTFDKPGVVALGCNIHDAMSGFVYVTATPFAALTDARGKVTIANVPAGGARVTVWHPSIRSPGGTAAQPITVGAAGFATVFALHR